MLFLSELSESEEFDETSAVAWAVPKLELLVLVELFSRCPNVAPTAPTAPGPDLEPSALVFPAPFFSRLSTDLIVIKDGFVLLPKLACRTSAGDCCTRPLRSSCSVGEVVPRSLVIVEPSSDSMSSFW